MEFDEQGRMLVNSIVELKDDVENEILLILGKGRESYQEIGTKKHPYSDVDIIKEFQYAG